ncbi:MAG: FkbM family methyltransferase [Flavobacteriales bacterium]|nr:FkbM family methyltransferase [Flavobacteriales bacterium]
MKTVETKVRSTPMKLMAHTRSLELCSRMNYETENLDFIDKMKEGDVMYDLGACEGRFSVYAALHGIRCVSFEPEQENFKVLTSNIELNGIDGSLITPLNYGVSDQTKEGRMNIGQPWAGGHQKVVDSGEKRADLDFDFKTVQEIKLISLDDAVVKLGIPLPNYLKVDIDGSEIPFMRGAQKVLSGPQLTGVIYELQVEDESYDFVVKNLAEHGFRENSRHQVPNEPNLFNIIFYRDEQPS